jgi:hypothetical protein
VSPISLWRSPSRPISARSWQMPMRYAQQP